MTTAIPTLEQLKSRLTKLQKMAMPFSETVFRSCTPKYASQSDLLTGEGSRQNGGRWNPKGIAAIYASLTPETAMAETLAHYRYYAMPIEDAMHRTFVAIETHLNEVIDRRQGIVRQRIGISLNRILTVDWRKEVSAGNEPVTQRLGRAAYEINVEALIVPSAADPDGYNVLIFPDNLKSNSTIRLLHDDQLTKQTAQVKRWIMNPMCKSLSGFRRLWTSWSLGSPRIGTYLRLSLSEVCRMRQSGGGSS